MILTRSTSLVTVSLFCLVAMPASGAMGATKKAPVRPTISSVAPLKAGVGDQLTIKGKNFVLGKNKNTVFFKAGSKPAVTAKAAQATRTTIKVVIPKSLEKYITVTNGIAQPTRVRLKVLAKRFGKAYTTSALSPTITMGNATGGTPGGPATGPAADCDGDGIVNSVDADDDNDLLTDALDAALKLNPCSADTDGDGVEDGYEYQSALDLNNTVGQSLPYPGKRPYPNPLDGGDATSDFDGDGLGMAQEHLMWKAYGPASLVLSYSAGLKKSTPGGVFCPTIPSAGCNDDFRDVDSDGLSNWDEFNGRMTPAWWKARYPSEAPYTDTYLGTSAIDPDSDGDTLVDGADDADHDLWPNAEELDREGPVGPPRGDGVPWYRVQPFNPCLPDYNSPTCSEHPPLANPYPPFPLGNPAPPSPLVIGPPGP
jgi:hypothetical protein